MASCIRSQHSVQPDWLAFTVSAEDDITPQIIEVISFAGYRLASVNPSETKIRYCHHDQLSGSVLIRQNPRFVLVSFSGGALRTLNSLEALVEIIQIICVIPSLRITRLDLCIDLEFLHLHDVAERLDVLESYAMGAGVQLSRKRVPFEKVSRLNTFRPDPDDSSFAVATGTLYIGNRGDTVYAKVYDKRAQMAAVHNLNIEKELLRIEVSANRGRATLRDLVEPDALFFWIASPDLIARPDDVPQWEQLKMDPRSLPPVRRAEPYTRLKSLAETSPDIVLLRGLLEQHPQCRPMVIRTIMKMLSAESEKAA